MSAHDSISRPTTFPGPAAVPDGDGRRPAVTIAAYYGAGGTVVGRLVAQRLGVEFLDRGVVPPVAAKLRVPEETVESYTDHSSGIGTLLGSLARVAITNADPVARRSTGIPRTTSGEGLGHLHAVDHPTLIPFLIVLAARMISTHVSVSRCPVLRIRS